jgi:DNA polymerase III subunit epsilon
MPKKPFIPAGSRPLAFLDVETTGLDTALHEVIEIGILRGEDPAPQEWHSLVKPERLEVAEQRALEINGYATNPDRWNGAPTMAEVGAEVVKTLEGCVIIGQNVSYDLDILKRCLQRAGVDVSALPWRKLDTMTLSYEHLIPLGLQGLGLQAVRRFLGWSEEGAHTAMGDVRDTRNLFHLLLRATQEDLKKLVRQG